MNLHRVMGVDECGSEFCIANDLTKDAAYARLVSAQDDYPESRCIFVEEQIDYRSVHSNMSEDEQYMSDY